MFRVSCIQLKSNSNIEDNFIKTERLIKKAISQKADFILTPEVSSLFTLNKKQLLNQCTSMNKDEYLKGIKKLAKKYKKWILIGSLVIKTGRKKLANNDQIGTNVVQIEIKNNKTKVDKIIFDLKKYCSHVDLKSTNISYNNELYIFWIELKNTTSLKSVIKKLSIILILPQIR